jgi:hypothetical protein
MPYSGSTHYLAGWLTSGTQNITLGVLPIAAYVVRVHIHCTTAFNAGGSDEIRVGYDADEDAYATLTDVSTSGVKTVTAGAGIGYDTTARSVEAYFVNTGAEPSAGRALVIVEYFLNPVVP